MIPNQNFYDPNPVGQQTQPQQYGYPPQLIQPPYYPVQPPSIPLQVLVQQVRESRDLAVENVQLRNRMTQKELAETANTEVFKSWANKIFTRGRNGMPQLLLNCSVEESLHILPQPPSRQPPFFYIQFHAVDEAFVISEQDFYRDSRFIMAIQELPGVEVTPRRSQKLTAMLLRQAIAQEIVTVHLNFYGGWNSGKGGTFGLSMFPGFSTHRRQDQFELPAPLPTVSESETVVAAQRFWPIFTAIRDLFARHLLLLWFHTSALTTLLDQLGYHVPLALNCLVTDPDQRQYLKHLFSWYGDAPLSLDLRPADFTDGLLARRDQPLVLEDTGRQNHAATNAQTLETVLSTGTVCWQSGKDVTSLPIHALITIISSGSSELACAPEICDLDLPPESFDRDCWLSGGFAFDSREYLAAFASYTTDHIAELQTALALGREQAMQQSKGRLNEKCLDTYGILLGIGIFLADFFEFCSPANPPVPDMLNDMLLKNLFNLLEQTSEKDQLSDIPDVFIAVFRQQLQRGLLSTCPQHSFTPDRENLVVFNDQYLHFTSSAFRCVCGALCQSYPVILNALADAGLFCGRQVNARTAQTRISVWDDHGERRSLPGYSFSRDAFDLLGDPLVLDGEVGE